MAVPFVAVLLLIIIIRCLVVIYRHHRLVGHVKGVTLFVPATTLKFLNLVIVPLRRAFPSLSRYFMIRHEFEKQVVIPYFENNPDAKIMRVTSPSRTECAIVTRDVEIIKDVLIHQRDISDKPHLFYQILSAYGPNIISAPNSIWRKHRSLANPAFSEGNLHLVVESTNDMSEKLFSKWESLLQVDPKQSISIPTYMQRLTLGILSHAGFGHPLEDPFHLSKSNEMNFGYAMEVVSNNLLYQLLLPSWLKKLPLKKLQHIRGCFQYYEKYVHNIIAESKTNDSQNAIQSMNLLNLLARSKEDGMSLTSEEVFGDAFILILAGHETTTHTLEFAIHQIASYPDVQQKMYEEVMTVVGDTPITYEHYKELHYTRCVLKETLRLFPIVPFILRVFTEDTVLAGISIPKGTHFRPSIYGLHMNPKYWEKPHEFVPERFDERVRKVPSAYMPFGLGTRSCLGSKFAMVESVTFLANLVRKFRLESPSKMMEYWDMTTRPVPDVKVVMKVR